MNRSALTKHRAFAGVLLLILLFACADYFLNYGLLGRRLSKGILLLTIGIVVVYGSFFAPKPPDKPR